MSKTTDAIAGLRGIAFAPCMHTNDVSCEEAEGAIIEAVAVLEAQEVALAAAREALEEAQRRIAGALKAVSDWEANPRVGKAISHQCIYRVKGALSP